MTIKYEIEFAPSELSELLAEMAKAVAAVASADGTPEGILAAFGVKAPEEETACEE